MKSFRTKKWLKGLMLAMLLIVGSTVFSASAKEKIEKAGGTVEVI